MIRRLTAVLALAGALASPMGAAWAAASSSSPCPLVPASTAVRNKEAGVQVRYMGVSTLLFEAGRTRLLIDGFFSRPNKARVLLGRIGPDPERIAAALQAGGLDRVDAVLAAQAHYDHAMDSADVAYCTGALLVGSRSVANIALGRGFSRYKVIEGGEQLRFDDFAVTPIPAPHASPVRYEGVIDTPLRPPARARDYKEGGSFSYLLEHRNGAILVHPGANFRPGLYRGRKIDVVFLGVGELGRKHADFTRQLWDEVVGRTGARLVIPIHWDDFTRPLEHGLRPLPWPADDFGRTLERLDALGRRDGVEIRLLRAFEATRLPPRPAEP